MPLEILLLYDCLFPESIGGVEHRNECMARALSDRGHHVTIGAWTKDPEPRTFEFALLPLAFGSKLHNEKGRRTILPSLKFALACSRIDIRKFDVIETANIPYAHLLVLSALCAWHKKPLVITWHEFLGPYWPTYEKSAAALLYRYFESVCAHLSPSAIAVSPLTAGRLQLTRGKSRPVSVVPNGIWVAGLAQILARPKITVPALFYAGRLVREKRLDILLRAVTRMPHSSAEPLLGIVGDGPEKQHLEKLAEQLGITSRVKFYGKLADIEDMWHMLSNSRIAVTPSAREGFGMFACEAMGLGIPVVYCKGENNAISALVRDGLDGYCVEPDPEAIANTLSHILNDKGLWQKLSSSAKVRAASYDWSIAAEKMETLFQKAIRDCQRDIG